MDEVAALMSEDSLERLGVQHFGDRVAIKAFARTKTEDVSNISSTQSSEGLLKRIFKGEIA